MNNFENKKILLIICGGIAAYKSLELIRLFKKKGAFVKTILTKNANKFVTPLSVTSLSQEKVYSDLFEIYLTGSIYSCVGPAVTKALNFLFLSIFFK